VKIFRLNHTEETNKIKLGTGNKGPLCSLGFQPLPRSHPALLCPWPVPAELAVLHRSHAPAASSSAALGTERSFKNPPDGVCQRDANKQLAALPANCLLPS